MENSISLKEFEIYLNDNYIKILNSDNIKSIIKCNFLRSTQYMSVYEKN